MLELKEHLRETLNRHDEVLDALIKAQDRGDREALERIADAYRYLADSIIAHICNQGWYRQTQQLD